MPKKQDYTLNVVVIGPVVTSADQIDAAFNEWMRRSIEEPEKFLREWQAVVGFQHDEAHGKAPSYGRDCTNYLLGLLKEREKPKRKRATVKRRRVKR